MNIIWKIIAGQNTTMQVSGVDDSIVTSPVEVVNQWQDALNRQDADALLTLSNPNIEIVGPRGSAYGHQILRDWLGRAGLTLTTLRAFARNDNVVVAQRGVWQSADTSGVPSEAEVASYFVVRDGRVVRYARYDDLASALKDANLTETDATAPSR